MGVAAIRPECVRCGQRVGWVGVGVNLAMVAMKVFVGLAAGSRACLADALHSGSNIVTAFAIFVSRKLTSKPIDDDHPYGHGKVEFIAAGAVSLVIMLLTIVLVVTSLQHIIYKPVPPPHLTAGLVALVSIIVNEILFRYFRCAGTVLRSQTITANAWANRADSFSSTTVVVGVIGSRLGFHHLDPIAAVVVAVIIVKVSIRGIREAVTGLMDHNVPTETDQALRRAVAGQEGVRGLRYLRARNLGNKIWVDLGVIVSPQNTVSECEEIGERLRAAICAGVTGVEHVQVDYEPMEDG
jgi:cation diffusion facilitator family transporter